MKDNAPGRKKKLPVICSDCGRERVYALRRADRVLIRCDGCGARIFAYYTDRQRWGRDVPSEEGDELLVRQVERELLRMVSPGAAELYVYLRRYDTRHGYAPTLREMQHALGWRSPNSASHHLRQLEAVGLIERDYGEVRGIRLIYAGAA